MRSFKAAAVQFCASVSIEENIDTLATLIREAASLGAHYIQTPEMSNLLQPNRPLFFETIKQQDQDPMLSAMRDLAKELNIHLHLGSLAIKVEDKKAANRGFMLSPKGEIIAHYDKMNLFDVTLPDGTQMQESAAYIKGEKEMLCALPFAKLGMTICYDMRFPQLYRALAQQGATVLTMPSSFTVPTGQAHWHILLRARAIETGSFVIAAAQGGHHESGRVTYGHSLIINPWGEIIAQSLDDKPCVILADITPQDALDMRQKIPNLKD